MEDSKSDENADDFQIESVGDDAAHDKKSVGQIEVLEAELKKAKNDFLYLRADFDNYRKGVIKDRSDMAKYGSERVFVELLNVLDNFERALQVELNADSIAVFKEGIHLTSLELKKVLESFGVKEIPSEGTPFDPNVHEALSSEPTEAVAPGSITKVFKKAYKLHDRVIRHGQVVVAKTPEK